MVMILDFSIDPFILRLAINNEKWCRVSLVLENKVTYLGAERVDYIVKHLLESLSDDEKTINGYLDGFPVYWVLSLSEAHTILYMANELDGRVLFWQDSGAKILTTLQMREEQKRDCLQKLLILQKTVSS